MTTNAPCIHGQPIASHTEDGPLELKVDFFSHPNFVVTWKFGENKIEDNDRIVANVEHKNDNLYTASLIIKDPYDSDEGQYRCQIVNAYGRGNTTFNVTMSGFSSPTFVMSPKIRSTDSGSVANSSENNFNSKMILEFQAKSVLPPDFQWKRVGKNGETSPLIENERSRLIMVEQNDDIYYSALEIRKPLKANDAGQFLCVMTNSSGQLTAKFDIEFSVLPGTPTFTSAPKISQIVSKSGDPAMLLEVQYKSRENAECLWENSKKKKIRENEKISFDVKRLNEDCYTAQLQIVNYRPFDSGTYICRVRNKIGEAFTEFTLIIDEDPDEKERKKKQRALKQW